MGFSKTYNSGVRTYYFVGFGDTGRAFLALGCAFVKAFWASWGFAVPCEVLRGHVVPFV